MTGAAAGVAVIVAIVAGQLAALVLCIWLTGRALRRLPRDGEDR